MRVEGSTYPELANYVNEFPEFAENPVNASNLRDYFEKNTKQVIKALKDTPELQEKVASQYFNTLNQLNRINEEIWGLYYDLKKDPEHFEKKFSCPSCGHASKIKIKQYDTLLKVSDQILKQITHADKILGNLKTNQLNITFNYNEMNNKILSVMPELLPKLEKQGVLTLHKKKFNKMFY